MVRLIWKYTLRSVLAWKLILLLPIIPLFMYKEAGSLLGLAMVNILFSDFRSPEFLTSPYLFLYKITDADIRKILFIQHMAIVIMILLWAMIGTMIGYWLLTVVSDLPAMSQCFLPKRVLCRL